MASNSESPTKGKADRAAVPVSEDAQVVPAEDAQVVPVIDPAEAKAAREAGGAASSTIPANKLELPWKALITEALEKGQTVMDSIKMRAEMDSLKLEGKSSGAVRSEIRPAIAEPDLVMSGTNVSKVDDAFEEDKTEDGSAPRSP